MVRNLSLVTLFCLSLAIVASAYPRYIAIPIEDVQFVGSESQPQAVYLPPPPRRFMRRQAPAVQEDEVEDVDFDNRFRRQAQYQPGPVAPLPGGPPQQRDFGYGGHQGGHGGGGHGGYGGSDYVDYGAYTGGKGAFGWYTDHPVGGGYH